MVHLNYQQLTHPVGESVEHPPGEVVLEQQADAASLPGPVAAQQLVAREVD